MRVAVERVGSVGAASRHAVGIVARQRPAEALREPHAIAGAGEVAIIVGVTLRPQEAAAAIAGIPRWPAVVRRVGMKERIDVGIVQRRIGEGACRQRCAVGMGQFLMRRQFRAGESTTDAADVATFARAALWTGIDRTGPRRLWVPTFQRARPQRRAAARIGQAEIIDIAAIAPRIGGLVIANIQLAQRFAVGDGANIGGDQVPLVEG